MGLMELAYKAPAAEVAAAATARGEDRSVLGSGYLGAVLPDTAPVHALIGFAALRDGRPDAAVGELREALRLDPNSATANRNLAEALDAAGNADALPYFRRAVELDPNDANAQHGLGSALLSRRDYADAAAHLKLAVQIDPRSATAHNDLGVALASMGQVADARQEFSAAVALQPDFAEARRNLAAAESARRK
jgi:Flp pilus assembly protein TadD